MATHGSMKTFNDWTTYADKKRSILLTVCGAPTYKLLRSLSGGSQDTKSYDDLAALLKTHFNPKSSAIVQRYEFNTRARAKVNPSQFTLQHCGT